MKMFEKTCLTLLTLIASSTHQLKGDQDEFISGSAFVEEQENSGGHFFIGADVLYWKPHVTGLELDFGTGTIAEVISDGVEVMTTDEFDADPHFKWNTGYRISAGYQFECSDWELDAVWTQFRDSGSRSRAEDADTTNRTKCDLKFEQIDVAMTYINSVSPCFKTRTFVGVRGAKIHEKLNALLVTDITIAPSTAVTETRTFDDHQRYWGVGPVLGLQGDWDIGCGFGIYGSIAASILYGNYKLHFHDTDIFTAPIGREIFSTSTRHLRGFDCNIDLAVGLSWETTFCDSYQVRMNLGFEHHQYFNQSRLGTNRGDLTFDGGIFSLDFAL